MKKLALIIALVAFAPLARAQEAGHWENRSKQVWQEAWIEIEARKAADGSTEQVKVEHPGQWKTVTERVWVKDEPKKAEKPAPAKKTDDYVKPWDDAPKSAPGRTEKPQPAPAPSPRTEKPLAPPAPAPRTLPAPTERPTSDPFSDLGDAKPKVVVPAPAGPKEKFERDPLVVIPAPQPAPPPPVVERVVVIREPRPPIILSEGPEGPSRRTCERVYVERPCVERRVIYVDPCPPRRVIYEDCGPRVRVGVGFGVGVRIGRHVGVRFGF